MSSDVIHSPTPPPTPRGSAQSIIPPSASSAPEALVFTDIVNSTAIKACLTSQTSISALHRHNDLYAQCVALSLGASIIKHTGDGLFARFQTASEAARCSPRRPAPVLRRTEHRADCTNHGGL